MTNTPSEGPATTGTRELTPDETLIAARVHDLIQAQQARRDELRQQAADAQRRSPLRRAGRVAPWVGIAAVGSQTEPGQQVLAAGQDAAVAAGHGIADAGVAVGNAAVDAGEAVGNAAVSAGEAVGNAAVDAGEAVGNAAVSAGEAVGHAAEAVGREAAHVGEEIGQGAVDAYNASVHGVEEAAGAVGHAATSAASAVSGWAVETWHSASDAVTTAAHAVGGWAAQYGDQIAAHPGNAAVTAGLGAAAVVAATPALRQGIGNAIKGASRWAGEALDAVKQKGRELAVGAMLAYNNLRGIDVREGSPKEIHHAVNEANAIAGGDRPLPTVEAVREALATPGSDPALAAVGSKQPEAAAETGQATGSGAAERTGAVADPKTKSGQAQGL